MSNTKRTASSLPRSRFPVTMTVLSTLVLTGIVLAHVFVSDIEDAMAIGLDVISVASLGMILLLLAGWVLWFLLFSRWRWWNRLIAAAVTVMLPVGFMMLFRPVNGGDANIVRFEPIWTQRVVALKTEVVADNQGVDLKTESADDFPRFLGVNQNASVTSGRLIDASQFDQAKIVWKQAIGQGWSGFSARHGFAVTMEQRGENECITCYEIVSGELRWIHQHPARHRDAMNLGRVGPRSTPTIHDGKVFAVGAVGDFVCLNGADGSVLWQADLNQLLQIQLGQGVDQDGFEFQYEQNTSLAWGRAGSPLIVDELVVIPGGGPKDGPKSTLLAFRIEDGELQWRGGQEMISYGSPELAELCGVRQIVVVAESKVMGFDPSDGNVLWEHSRPGESGSAANTSQVNILGDDELLTSKGYPDGGGERLRLKLQDGQFSVETVWNNPTVLKTKLTSPVINDGFAYSFSNGFLECARLSDGERIWKRRGRFGHGQMLLVGRLLLVHSEEGILYLIEATPDEYRELGSLKTINGVCWNTLCLYGDKLLVRSELEAACIQLPTTSASVALSP